MMRRRRLILGSVVLAAGLALAACTTGNTSTQAEGANLAGAGASSHAVSTAAPSTSAASTPPAPATPAVVTVAPKASKPISPSTPITVSVADGTLSSVKLVNRQGYAVTGQSSANGASWTNIEDLGYGKTYTLSAIATNSLGVKTVKTASYTTVTPPNQTMPYFYYTGGYALTNGATYGVGIVPIVHFDEPITDRSAALSTITITTTPHVAGAWYWSDDQNVAFRPQHFWPAGTKVHIDVKDYGKQVSPGLYGQADISTGFKIGAQHITVAYDNAPSVDKVKVYFSGKLVKTMNTSMGEHTGEQVGSNYIDFHTMKGTYTVLEHDDPAIMSSASYGLPASDPHGYGPEPIYYATKISTDGIYLHELDTTVWAQDNGDDVSHGCLNLNHDNAVWFYTHSQIGDVVEIAHTDGPLISYNQGGAWSVPWKTWVAGGTVVP